jgi:hypothetical protein
MESVDDPIRKKVQLLEKTIEISERRIEEIQRECKHLKILHRYTKNLFFLPHQFYYKSCCSCNLKISFVISPIGSGPNGEIIEKEWIEDSTCGRT